MRQRKRERLALYGAILLTAVITFSEIQDPLIRRTMSSDTGTSEEWIPVFYNLFVGSEDDLPMVETIVEEQFSYLHSLHKVFVRSIGVPMKIENTTVLRQDETGSEMETLALIWQHCNLNPNGKVVYMHSKGSFHPSTNNNMMRQFLTRGALSEECTFLPETCNVCSSRMSPTPHPHTPGNMWLARCDYVRKLIDPMTFVDAMNKVDLSDQGNVPEWCLGRERFAQNTGSIPTLQSKLVICRMMKAISGVMIIFLRVTLRSA
jgi:hypothetical protein